MPITMHGGVKLHELRFLLPKRRGKENEMFKAIYVWLILLIESIMRPLSAPMEERKYKPLKLDLQFFAREKEEDDPDDDSGDDVDDEGSDDDSDEDDADDEPDIDELLKDKRFKRQYQKKMKEQLGKRMKKYKDVDPEEYRRLKEQAGKKKEKQDEEDDEEEELETLRNENKEKEKRLLRAERREKNAMVKEFAVDNQVNPKLLSRLINVDDIELDDEGDPENLDELYEELEEEFPEYLGEQDDEEDEEEDELIRKRKTAYRPGSRQKNNKKTKKEDRFAKGAERAKNRHKKEDAE
ncbi:hypothetical protein LF822_06560 [Halobacillus sp. A5]|nr:hypothetical protein [Halobacillus sp. A5]